MKKLISVFLTLSLILSLNISAVASGNGTLIYDEIDSNGARVTIYKEDVSDSVTIGRTFVDGELTHITTRTYSPDKKSFTLKSETIEGSNIVDTSISTKTVSPKLHPVVPYEMGIIEGEMGTMHYVNGNIRHSVRLTAYTYYNTEAIFEKDTWLTPIVDVAFDLAGQLDADEGQIISIINNPLFSVFGEILEGTVHWWTLEKLEATFYHHYIGGESITDPEIRDGQLEGQTYFVKEGRDKDEYFTFDYTPFDWGTHKLSDAMFLEMYGVELSPVTWQQAA